MPQHTIKRGALLIAASLALALVSAPLGTPRSAQAADTAPSPKPEGPRPASRALDETIRNAKVAELPPAGRSGGIVPRDPSGPQRREVFGYADLANLAGSYSTWDFSQLTTVALFGLHVQGDGNLAHDTPWQVWNSGVTSQFVQTAHSNGVRVLITLVQLTGPPAHCDALNHSYVTAPAIAAEVSAKAVDGVSIDYEGGGSWCGTPPYTQNTVTLLTARVRQALAAGAYLSIATYAAAATPPPLDNDYFNLAALNPWVDSFFVMAYDSNFDNANHSPLTCCNRLSPTAPLNGYYYNQTRAATEYAAMVPSTKVLMGIPYYSYAACVSNLSDPNQVIVNNLNSPRYIDSVSLPTDPLVSQFSAHRDLYSTGQERWDTYVSGYWGNCNRQNYWDDVVSLGAKYDNVIVKNLRGIGIWTLNYGYGQRELWDLIRSKFSGPLPGSPGAVSACPGNGFASVTWTPPAVGAPFVQNQITGSPGGSATVSGAAVSGVVTGLTNGTAYNFTVTTSNGAGIGPTSPASNQVVPALPPGSWPGQYHPLPPTRILDTRVQGGRLGPGQTYALGVLGQGGVPSTGVSAVILNVTETNPSAPGYFTVFPDQTCRPLASSVDFQAPGWTSAALTLAALGPGGKVAVYNGSQGGTDLVVDVQGYVAGAPSSGPDGHIRPISPRRLADSRNGTGGIQRFSPSTHVQTIDAVGSGIVPADAEAIEINLTATDPTAPSYFSIFPADGSPGLFSSLNFVPGQTVANRAFVPLSPDGKIRLFNAEGSTDALIDVTAWFTRSSGGGAADGLYTGVTPVRILDTRDGTGGVSGRVPPNSSTPLTIFGKPGLPSSGIKLVVLSVTVADGTLPSYLAVSPVSSGAPGTSDLNFLPNTIVPNLVVAPLTADGKVFFYNAQGMVSVIADLVGWYS